MPASISLHSLNTDGLRLSSLTHSRCLVWLLWLYSGAILAGDGDAQVLQPSPAALNSTPPTAEALIIGTEDINYYPHYGRQGAHSNEMIGLAYDLFEAFSRLTETPLRYQLIPVKRLYQQFLVDQRVDLKYPDHPGWQVEQKRGLKIHYSQPIAHYIDGLLVHPKLQHLEINQLHTIGTIRGFTPVPYLRLQGEQKIEVIEFSQTEDLLKAVLSLRIQGAYMNIDVAQHQLKTLFGAGTSLIFQPQLPYQHDYYYLSTIKYPEQIIRFNRFIDDYPLLVRDLKLKHGLNPTPPPKPYQPSSVMAPQEQLKRLLKRHPELLNQWQTSPAVDNSRTRL